MRPQAILSGTKVLVGNNTLKSQLIERGFGEKVENRLELSLIEALFLVDEGKVDVIEGNRRLSFEELVKKGTAIEPEFYNKYKVYADLRKRGLLVRTGFKFGSDFRVYERGVSVGEGHSKYLVHVVPEEYSCSLPELARAIRLAGNVNKEMIYAVVDEEGDVTYYKIGRVKL